MVAWLWIGFLLLAGCSREAAGPELTQADFSMPDDSLIVSGNRQWVDTGVEVTAGDALTVLARGKVVVRQQGKFHRKQPVEVGPNGTFFFSEEVAEHYFPLPSGARGPAPCYCLIGRIGDGPPFFVGRRKSWVAERSGRLELGVNDFDVSDNCGQFYAKVTKPGVVQPVSFQEAVPYGESSGGPCPGCSLVVFYVDGLRPDVVREMAAMGHLPNINRLFLEGGAWSSNTFTAFPSDTITSNGTMWTGCFSDRHGLKGQVRFSRRTLHSESYLEPLGPSRSARLLAPQGVDKVIQNTQAASIRLFKGDEASTRWRSTQTSGVAPIYQHLRAGGSDWATGVLPLMTQMPPLLWARSLMRYLPYLHAQEAWKYIDNANTHYATRHLLGKQPVTIIWLPETDSFSHKYRRGQFGMTRRTIAQADVMVGNIVRELQAQGRLQKTYLMLVSDHGHHGGRKTHLSHFDLANEFFYKPREMSPDGCWIGGGLGLSVRQHRFWNRHRGDKSREFVFLDGDSDGVARIFLPRGNFRSGKWTGAHCPADLLAYKIADHLPPFNLIESLTAVKAVHGSGEVQHPIDLVLMKISDRHVLISTVDRGHAVIDRKKNDLGRWIYKYTPVESVAPITNGEVASDFARHATVDPLGLLDHLQPPMLEHYYDEKTWLNLTMYTGYPDGVVAFSRHMLWQENLQYREAEFAPDLVVTARKGWYFGIKESPGTMHGYPFPDSMRATLFFSGPNIRRGARIDEPCRLVDLTPTILEMVGFAFDENEFDGTALRNIYKPAVKTVTPTTQPVYWQDVDLQAWHPLNYRPLKRSAHLPFTVNRPSSAFDLNSLAYNALLIGDLSILRLFDDVLFPLSGEEKGVSHVVESTDRRMRRARSTSVAEAVQTLNLPGLTLSDYSFTSLGNLMRVDGAINWVQERSRKISGKLAGSMGCQTMLGMPVAHEAIDGTQQRFWELYGFAQRMVVHLLDETILNSMENGADHMINSLRRQPAEVIVAPPPLSMGRAKISDMQ